MATVTKLQIGDWVQALEEQTEAGFLGCEEWIHAYEGGIGHVMGFDRDDVIVTWERSGTTSTAYQEHLKRLGGANVGRSPIPDR